MPFQIPDAAQRLIDSYKETSPTLNDRQKAEREHEIFLMAPCNGSTNNERVTTLSNAMNEKIYHVRARRTLLLSDDWATELWRRVLDEGLPKVTAASLLILARNKALREGKAPTDVLKVLLADYDKNSLVITEEGARYRRVPKGKGRTPDREETKAEPVPKSGETDAVVTEDDLAKNASPRSFWFRLRKTVETYLVKQLEEDGVVIDPIRREQILEEFSKDLKISVETAQRRFSQEAKAAKNKSTLIQDISRRDIIKSCVILKMDPPRTNEAINLKLAKRQKQRLASLYHPDANNGDRSKEDLYNAVLDAYDKLEQYANRPIVPIATAV